MNSFFFTPAEEKKNKIRAEATKIKTFVGIL